MTWDSIAVSLITGTFHYTGDLVVDAELARLAARVAQGFGSAS